MSQSSSAESVYQHMRVPTHGLSANSGDVRASCPRSSCRTARGTAVSNCPVSYSFWSWDGGAGKTGVEIEFGVDRWVKPAPWIAHLMILRSLG